MAYAMRSAIEMDKYNTIAVNEDISFVTVVALYTAFTRSTLNEKEDGRGSGHG